MLTRKILILSIFSLLLAACAATKSATPTLVAFSTDSVPTPVSTLIGQFVWQTDGLCGYHILRPERWNAYESECRAYVPTDSKGQNNELTLRVANYQVMAQQQTEGIIAQYELFKQDPSLKGWTKSVEQMWQSNGIESSLVDTLSQAKIYSLRSPGSTDLQIVALVTDEEHPLLLSLNVSGEYADLDRLRNEHLWDDFVTMVKSLRAINYDASNVTPSLP